MNIKNILNNRIFILSLGIINGLVFGRNLSFLKPITIYVIGLILAFSLSGFSFNHLKINKKNLKRIYTAIILNYILFNIFLLLGGKLFFNDNIFMGLIIVAATPPAVAIIPISISINANNKLSLMGVIGGNIAALIISPLLIYFFVDNNIPIQKIIWMLIQIIMIPIVFSRFLRLKSIYPFVEKVRTSIIDWGFFLIASTIIGMSKTPLLHNINTMISLLIFYSLLIMVFGSILYFIFVKFKMNHQSAYSSMMLFGLKNAGFAAVLCLFLFPNNPESNLSAAALSIVIPFYFIFIMIFKKWIDNKMNFKLFK